MAVMELERLKIASKSENMVLVEKMINNVCKLRKVGEDYYGNILVALTEAVTNAILHGNKGNPEKNVDIICDSTDTNLTFTVKDEGPGFDPGHIPDPTAPENIEKPSGRGVFLMKNLADKVEFSDNRRTVLLNFKVA